MSIIPVIVFSLMHNEIDSKDEKKNWGKLIAMSLGALGVVYGDIGTSPLYALKEIFFGKEQLETSPEHILGVISIVFWVLTMVVTIKYIVFVLRADHDNEGGVFALYAKLKKIRTVNKKWLLLLLIFAAGLLFGDGTITPAISVLSAVEGLGVITPSFNSVILPITIVILSALFYIQKQGTSAIGKMFGPIMLVWFIVLALLGISNVVGNMQIIEALNPIHAFIFFKTTPLRDLLVVLGFVMLVVTGGEAMYADLGHFGRTPIRLSWLTVAYPALILNYLGQGAYLLSGKLVAGGSIFYSMAPGWALVPLVGLSTIATIIASQALITGSFSLASQASALDLLPAMKTVHTHKDHSGQIYIPIINIGLYVGCIALVMAFQNSTNLASAYGLAVSGVMVVTTIVVGIIARYEWKWEWWLVAIVFTPFALIDSTFLVANTLKFLGGGYVPLGIGTGIMMVMVSWRWGMDRINSVLRIGSKQTVGELFTLREANNSFIPRTVFIVSDVAIKSMEDKIPPLNGHYLSRYELFPEHLIYISIVLHQEAEMKKTRIEVVPLDLDPKNGTILSVVVNFGFMEDVNLSEALKQLKREYPMAIHNNMGQWVFHVVHPKMYTGKNFGSIKRKIEYTLFKMLWKNSMSEEDFLGLDKKLNVTAEMVPVRVN
jgi:KUP system potassium uptake protein